MISVDRASVVKRGFCFCATSLVIVFLAASSGTAKPIPPDFDYSQLSLVTVFHGDRAKPLDSYARETLREISGREYYSKKKVDAEKGPHPWLARDPITNLLSMLFQAEDWQSIPCIYLDHADVKELLGLDSQTSWISYAELRGNRAFADALQDLSRRRRSEDSMDSPQSKPIDNNLLELHGALSTMEGVFTGLSMKVVPVEDTQGFRWLSLQELADRGQDESMRGSLQGLMTAFVEKKPEEFNRYASELSTNLRQQAAKYAPAIDILQKERFYNSFKPFRKSWMFLLAASLLFGVSMGLSTKAAYLAAWGFYILGFAMSSTALILRVMIAGRPPVSNMYESLVYMGWGVILFAGIFEVIHKRRIFGLCGSAMGVLVLILADMLPFDPGISPLLPVLRSNYWLLVHVMTIVISYSAFALATMIAHFSLCAYLFSPGRKDLIETANNFVYRSIQVGVLLLTVGTILGGVWANESWGRFWGWDPKETWSLISLVGYFALLHARFWGVIQGFGTAVCAILGFQLILMTWYGVNFILATGLHSYGFGSGGLGYLVAYEVAELAFMIMVAIRYKVVYPTLASTTEGEVTLVDLSAEGTDSS